MNKKILLLLIVLIIGFGALSYYQVIDYKLKTSNLTTSGLYNPRVYIGGDEIESGEYQLCAAFTPVNYQISEYQPQALASYYQLGIMYEAPLIESGQVDKFSCQFLTINSNQVLEGFNHDWNNVNYYLI